MERHTWLDETTLRVETYRSGFFTFQIGLDMPSLMPLFDRVADAQERFSKLSLWQISAQLEKEVIAASVFGTNTIEGGGTECGEWHIDTLPRSGCIKSKSVRAWCKSG